MTVKINSLELENVKRVKAFKLTPSQNGLTIIGGENGQGKTSVLDAIAWALGGNKFKPSMAKNKDSVIPPFLHIELNNGLVVERKGKNSDLRVIDPKGNKSGQALLDSFIDELALDLPKFMNSNNREKADTLLRIIGVGEKLAEIEQEENKIYQERTVTGRMYENKRGYINEMPYYSDAPGEPISVSELIEKQQDILARNGENQRKRANSKMIDEKVDSLRKEVENLTQKLEEKRVELAKWEQDSEMAHRSILDLIDESTEEIEENIRHIEEINTKVAYNAKHREAEVEAKKLNDDYNALTAKLNEIRSRKKELLNGADLPLPELSIEDHELTYKGQKWDNMSGSEQLKVAVSIIRKLNPNCGFVLVDKLEQMDLNTLREFGAWLESVGLQAIATRVSTGGECSIVIEDGYAGQDSDKVSFDEGKGEDAPKRKWEPGVF